MKKLSIKYFKIFGTEVYAHIPKERRKKLDNKAKKGVFVGYDGCQKGYRIWFSQNNKIETHKDVTFRRENLMPEIPKDNENENYFKLMETKEEDSQEGEEENEHEENEISQEDDDNIETAESSGKEGSTKLVLDQGQEPRYGLREKSKLQAPKRYWEYLFKAGEFPDIEEKEPTSYQDATLGKNADAWKTAMDEEIKALMKNDTWSLTQPPTGTAILSNRWVYKVKRKADGTIDRYRARLVAKGYLQQEDINYFETFSPVVRYESVRAILAIAAIKGMKTVQFDVKTAFLNGELEEEVYKYQPEGYNDKSGRVCKLKKGLYGLKQRARCWNRKLSKELTKIGMVSTKSDPCVFINSDRQTIMSMTDC